jgi:hypothetical protein
MTPSRLFITLAVGLGAAACQVPAPQQTVLAPATLTGSQQACLDYGFAAGTADFERCVQRERDARAGGRVARGYADSQLTVDARDACTSYGLQPGTAGYDRCVGRELENRRYRDDGTAVYAPASSPPTVVYTTPAYATTAYPAPAYAPAPYVETRTTGVPAFKDEFGFRYDAEGNRLDRNGNIISPQSTQP